MTRSSRFIRQFHLPFALAVATALLTPRLAHGKACGQIHIVFDKSGSMQQQLASGEEKWGVVKAAVKSFTTKFQDRIRFGFEYFPGAPVWPAWMGKCEYKPDKMGTYACVPGCTVFDPMDNAAASVAMVVDTMSTPGPGGDTPTSETMEPLIHYKPLRDPAYKNFVLLITDGVPNCSEPMDKSYPGGYSDVKSVAAIKALADSGVPVFVVGVGTKPGPDLMGQPALNTDVLDRMAEAGGMAQTGSKFKFYAADNPSELDAALDKIGERAGGATVGGSMCVYGDGQASDGGAGGAGGKGGGGGDAGGQGGAAGGSGRGADATAGCACTVTSDAPCGGFIAMVVAAMGAVRRRRR